jgi:hypothetical protein
MGFLVIQVLEVWILKNINVLKTGFLYDGVPLKAGFTV